MRKIIAIPSYVHVTRDLKDLRFNPLELRHLLMYFDEILYPVWATGVDFHSAVDGDVTVLIEQGYISRPEIHTDKPDIKRVGSGDKYFLDMINHLVHKVDYEPLCGGRDFFDGVMEYFNDISREVAGGVMVSSSCLRRAEGVCGDRQVYFGLMSCMPVPAAHVPIVDVLEFRERYSRELGALRRALTKTYLDVSVKDPVVGMKVAIEELNDSVESIVGASRKNFFGREFLNIGFKSPISDLCDVRDLAGVYALTGDLESTGVALALKSISLNFGVGWKAKDLPADMEHMEYVLSMKKEMDVVKLF